MTDEVDPKTPDEPMEASNSSDQDVISLEDLDEIFAKEDPEFSEEMSNISKDDELNKAEVEVVSFEEGEELEAPPTFMEKHKKLALFIKPILFVVRTTRNLANRSLQLFTDGIYNSFLWFKNDFPGAIKKSLGAIKNFLGLAKEKVSLLKKSYQKVPKKKKWGYLSIFVLAIGFSYLIVLTLGEGWLPAISKPLILKFDKKAEYSRNFSDRKDLIRLYEAFPQPGEFILLEKVVVNLKRIRPLENPMAAIEINLEVDANETAIEVKDRERQVLDVVQRTIEEFSYNDLISKAGKAKLKAAIRYDVNQVLNQGRVKRVLFNTYVLKP